MAGLSAGMVALDVSSRGSVSTTIPACSLARSDWREAVEEKGDELSDVYWECEGCTKAECGEGEAD